MAHIRPIKVFATAVACMFVWITARFWFASSVHVWRASCVIGTWLPLVAAAMFLYVRTAGDREDSLAAAWLVRALGVQSVLAWGVGMTDWLRGPPGRPPEWDADLGGPFVLVAFVVPFMASVWTMSWFASLARRLRTRTTRPVEPGEGDLVVAPFRGLAVAASMPPVARVPFAPAVVAAGATLVAFAARTPSYWVLAAATLPLAVLAVRNPRALWPGVGAVAWTAAAVASRRGLAGDTPLLALAVAWPWLLTGSVALYLAAVEGLLRARVGSVGPVASVPAPR